MLAPLKDMMINLFLSSATEIKNGHAGFFCVCVKCLLNKTSPFDRRLAASW